MNDEKPEGDSLGLRPYGEALKIGAEALVKGIGNICGPASEELGHMLRDRVSYWRACQMIALGEKFRAKMEAKGSSLESLSAPARIVMKVFEEGSWVEDDDIQSMWAGLLASSCTEGGKDDSNLIFINRLSQMTTPEVRLFEFVSRSAVESLLERSGSEVRAPVAELMTIAKVPDPLVLQRAFEHLASLGLLQYGGVGEDVYTIYPHDAGLHLYVRCQGHLGSPAEFIKTRRQARA